MAYLSHCEPGGEESPCSPTGPSHQELCVKGTCWPFRLLCLAPAIVSPSRTRTHGQAHHVAPGVICSGQEGTVSGSPWQEPPGQRTPLGATGDPRGQNGYIQGSQGKPTHGRWEAPGLKKDKGKFTESKGSCMGSCQLYLPHPCPLGHLLSTSPFLTCDSTQWHQRLGGQALALTCPWQPDGAEVYDCP